MADGFSRHHLGEAQVLGLRYDHQMITYTVMMVLTYLGFTAAPVTFVLAFLVLTGLHFGEADRIHAMICHQDGTELPVTWVGCGVRWWWACPPCSLRNNPGLRSKCCPAKCARLT